MIWGLTSLSFSRDEGATVLAVTRTYPQLVQMLGNVDVVHGAYYSLIWMITRIGGISELVIRLPSALAMAAAAGTVAALGRRLVSGMAGLAAGLAFAVLPTVSYFAQQGRDYAIVTALATAASYLLVRALTDHPRRHRWLAAYAVTLTGLGLANLFALLIIPAHAVTLVALARSRRAPVRGVMAGWLAACGAALTAVSPVVLAGYGQMHQIHWVKEPGLAKVIDVTRLVGPLYSFGAVAAVSATAVIVGGVRARRGPQFVRRAMRRPQPVRSAWPPKLCALALPWLLLPPTVLLTISLVHPIYAFRYIAFCTPAAALLIGTALVGAGPAVAAVGLAVIMLAGLPAQVAQRTPAAHKVNLRLVDQVVARYAQTGDALLSYSRAGGNNERGLAGIYPFGLGRLRDISQGETPVQSATIGGTYATSRVEQQRLATVNRLWVISWKPQPIPILHQLRVQLLRTWNVGGTCLRLYFVHHQHHHHHHQRRRTRRVTP